MENENKNGSAPAHNNHNHHKKNRHQKPKSYFIDPNAQPAEQNKSEAKADAPKQENRPANANHHGNQNHHKNNHKNNHNRNHRPAQNAPANPEATLDGSKVVWNTYDTYTINTVYVFYIGDQTVANIQNWAQLEAAAKAATENPYGTTGYKTYQKATVNEIDLPKNGAYVLRVAFKDAAGKSTTLSLAIDCTVERKPIANLKGTWLVFDENYNTTPVTETHIFYLGDQEVADNTNWTQLETAAKAATLKPFGKAGYKTFRGEALDSIILTTQGKYVLRIVYTNAEGVKKTISQEVMVPYVPTATLDETDVIFDQNNGLTPVKRVYVFYVGETVIKDLNNWDELVAAGQANKDVNGSQGYKIYESTELDQIKLPLKGNYILRTQYLDGADNDVQKVITQQLTVSFTVSVVNGIVRFDTMGDVTLNAVHVFFVGDSQIADMNNWNDLVNAGLEHTDVNGKYGYSTKRNDAMYKIAPTVNGDYVLRVEYKVGDSTEVLKLTKRFTLEMGPVVSLVDGKLDVDTRGMYTVDTMTIFYIGDKTVNNPNEWNNCVKAAADIEGSPYGATGYTMLQSMEAIEAEELSVAGKYLMRVNYKRDGQSFMMIAEIVVE